MNPTSPYKPSPLSFGSPRTSPFRRPSSPGSPSNTVKANTPGSSPGRGHTPIQSPSKLNQSYTVPQDEAIDGSQKPTHAPRYREPPQSPTRGANDRDRASSFLGSQTQSPRHKLVNQDALGQLPPAQLREMREAFQVLDRDNDGSVNRDDVADILLNLGLDSSSAALSQFFPTAGPQNINLPTFLNTLSTLLAPLSSQKELLNALSAFDDDDSGQIDVAELRDALLHTSPDAGDAPLSERDIDEVLSGFTGRRAFGGKSSKASSLNGVKKGEVFRYQEFVSGLTGGTESSSAHGKSEDVKVKG